MGADLTPAELTEDAPPVSPPSLARRAVLAVVGILALAAFVGSQLVPPPDARRDGGLAAVDRPDDEVVVLLGEPTSLDPARHGDAASAEVIAQLHETLTAYDPALQLRPALAESWAIEDGGRRTVFTLRDGLTFSDGAPLTAADVVYSWRRLVDPDVRSPLASLLADVAGAEALLDGSATDPATLGVRADGDRRVIVDMARPTAELPSIASSPPLAIVPAHAGPTLEPDGFVGSGAYTLAAIDDDGITFTANPRYWAGSPPIATVRAITDLGGGSPVEAFEDGRVDVAPIGDFDARWIAWDALLGPQLRSSPSLGVTYYGFDTRRPPFDDARVRRAFAHAVDWARIGTLEGAAQATAADSMVPVGVPGRPDGSFLPAFDPAEARRLLAEAGYPDGTGFPRVTLLTAGSSYDSAVVAELREHLGVEVAYESMDFMPYVRRLETDPPAMWQITWLADYPSPADFLAVLLRSGATANYSRWSDPEFDAAVNRAIETADEAASARAYADALAIVRDEAPVVPVAYGVDWWLSREGLLGATPGGMGTLRFASLAWDGDR